MHPSTWLYSHSICLVRNLVIPCSALSSYQMLILAGSFTWLVALGRVGRAHISYLCLYFWVICGIPAMLISVCKAWKLSFAIVSWNSLKMLELENLACELLGRFGPHVSLFTFLLAWLLAQETEGGKESLTCWDKLCPLKTTHLRGIPTRGSIELVK